MREKSVLTTGEPRWNSKLIECSASELDVLVLDKHDTHKKWIFLNVNIVLKIL